MFLDSMRKLEYSEKTFTHNRRIVQMYEFIAEREKEVGPKTRLVHHTREISLSWKDEAYLDPEGSICKVKAKPI